MAVSVELLRNFDLLAGLPDDALSFIAEQATLKQYARREVVLSAGLKDELICFVFEGRLQGVDFTIDGREVGLYFVEQNDFCGETGLFDDAHRSDYVIAITKTQVVALPYAAVRHVMSGASSFILAIAQRMAQRIRYLTLQRSLLAIPNVQQRVCAQLSVLIESTQSLRAAGGVIELMNPPTHQEMAIMLNISRETVTRVFQVLISNEVVQRNGTASLIIIKPDVLDDVSTGAQTL